jgi:hypothetical protein
MTRRTMEWVRDADDIGSWVPCEVPPSIQQLLLRQGSRTHDGQPQVSNCVLRIAQLCPETQLFWQCLETTAVLKGWICQLLDGNSTVGAAISR